MASLKSYLSNQFSRTFFVVFLPLFFIVTLVYFVRISILTAQIKVDVLELLELYLYFLPSIIFYTLPISFIVSLSTVLVRLSSENELIALYSLGVDSKSIILNYFKLATIFSVLLLVTSLLAMPIAKQSYNAFKSDKIYDAKLNFTPGSLGQKFGDYYLYIEKQVGNTFQNIVIFSKKENNDEKIFVAKEGSLVKDASNASSFKLLNGYGYTTDANNILQIKYSSLSAFDTRDKEAAHFDKIVEYWLKAKNDEETMHRLLFFVFVSLIPLLSIFGVAAFSMINPRYQGNSSFAVILAMIVLLYAFASLLDKMGNIYILIAGVTVVIFGGRWIFKQRVERYF
jgi:lipopolysaccharide export system permease protein